MIVVNEMGNFEEALAFQQGRWDNPVTALYHTFEPLIRASSMASEMEFMLPPNQFGIVGGSASNDASECTLAICLEVDHYRQKVKKELIEHHLALAESFLQDVRSPRTSIRDGDDLKTLRKQFRKAWKNVSSINEATDIHLFTSGVISKMDRKKFRNYNGMIVHFYDYENFESSSQITDREADFEHLGGMPKVHLASSMEGDHDIYMGVVKGATIAALFDQMGNALLDTNVRLFLGEKSINRGIAKTIKEAPKRFAAFNNGITMVATRADVSGGSVRSASNVSIVNGGQTSVSIFRAQRKGVDISDVSVPLKLIVLHHDLASTRKLMLTEISKFSNSQNTVSTVDRMIMDDPHETLQKISLREDFDVNGSGWFYERKRGELDTLEMSDPTEFARRKARFPPSNIMDPSILGQCWITWWGVPELGASGRGKAFAAYHDRLQIRIARGRWDAETHHKQSAALWMIYDHLFQYIGKNFGGLRGATWPHTIGLLSSYTDKRLDLVSIWKRGSLPKEVKTCLEAIVGIVDEDIRRADEDITNPLEWAKSARCTSRLADLPRPRGYEDNHEKLRMTGAEEIEDEDVEQYLRDIGEDKLWDGYHYYKDLHRDAYNGSFFNSVMRTFKRNKASPKQIMAILREWNKFVNDGYKEKYPGPDDFFKPPRK